MQAILIVEDNEDLRAMLKELLEASGYGVLEAAGGQEAVHLALGKRPDLVLMDLGLPDQDGLSAVTEIRQRIPITEMPILMISAYDRVEYRTEAVSAGCSGYVAKPIDPAALLETIKLLLLKNP